MSTPIQNRYDFVYFFDVTDGNPNGDPGRRQSAAHRSRDQPGPRDRCLPEAQDQELRRRDPLARFRGSDIYIRE